MARRAALLGAAGRYRLGTVFLPNSLSGLQGWWRADAITSPPADGATLATWTDSSSAARNFTQATAGNQPTYRTTGTFLPNSKPCVEFTAASGTFMTASSVTANGDITRFVVLRAKTLGGSGTTASPLLGVGGHALAITDGGKVSTAIDGVAWISSDQGPATLVVNQWYILTVTDTTNDDVIYVNGALDSEVTTGHAAANATTMAIGGKDASTFLFDGYIAEAFDYNRVLSTTELGQMHSYLAAKYGITLSAGPSIFRNFDMDTSENQAGPALGWETGSAHQHAWITSRTRLGAGHAERMEIHNNTSTDMVGNLRALMSVGDTNDGGVTSGNIVGWPEVYWAWSSYLPTSGAGDADATVVAGFSQTTIPDYEHLFEFHQRANINGNTVGINNIQEVADHAVMVRGNQLQYRVRCGTWTWNGSSWNAPSWNTFTPGTNGSNDQIPIPIVKSGATNATMVMDTWIDIILHVRFRQDSTGLIEVWARTAGQTFTTSPNLSITGPTQKVVIGSDSVTRTTADVVSGQSGAYVEVGLYTGGTSWSDGSNGAHVHIFDEMRRYGTIAEAKANWG